jgi:DNA-binding MarR family transcriptional regulator
MLSMRDIVVAMLTDDSPDLTWRQTGVLLLTYHTPTPISVREISAELKISKPAVTRSIDRLETLNLIVRVTPPAVIDQRLVHLDLTESGRALVEFLEGLLPAPRARRAVG